MASATVNIFFKFPQMGKEIENSLKGAISAFDNVLNGSTIKPKIDASIDTVFTKVEETSGKIVNTIEDNVSSLAKKTETIFQNSGSKIVSTAEAKALTFHSRIVALVGGSLGVAGALIANATVAVLNGPMAAIKSSVASVLLGSLKTLNFTVRSLIESGKNIYNIITFSNAALLTTSNVMSTFIFGLGKIGGFFFFSRIFFSDAMEFLKRIVGKGEESLTPLQRASRLVTSIDSAVHQTTNLIGPAIKLVSFGVATIVGPFSGIVAGLATANSLVNLISRWIMPTRMQLASFFGSGRAQIVLIINSVKDFLYELVKINPAKLLLGGGKSLLQEFLEILKKLIVTVKDLLEKNRIDKFLNGLQLVNKEVKNVNKESYTSLGFLEKIGIRYNSFSQEIGKKLSGINFSKIFNIAGGFVSKIKFSIGGMFKKSESTSTPFSPSVADTEQIKIEKTTKKYAKNLVNALEKSIQKEYKPDHIQKLFTTFMQQAFGTNVKIPFTSLDNVRKSFQSLALEIEKIPGSGGMGEKFTKALTEGSKKGASMGASLKAQKLRDAFLDVLNASIGKYNKAGIKIPEQVAKGMSQGKDKLEKATKESVQTIDDYFPHSPAKVGPLKTLMQSGAKIPEQIGNGIKAASALMVGPIKSIAESIIGGLKTITDSKLVADRIGITVEQLNLLEYAFAGFGITSQDLQGTFSQINRLLSDFVPPEQVAILNKLGIDLTKISTGAKPSLELLLSFSDAMSKMPSDSALAVKASEMLGVGFGTNLQNALKKSRAEIVSLMEEGAKTGAFATTNLANMGITFNTMYEKFKLIGNYIYTELFTKIMPPLIEFFEYIFDIITKEDSKFRAFLAMIGQALVTVFSIFKRLIQLSMNDTEKAYQIFYSMLNGVIQIVGTFAGNALDLFGGKISRLVSVILDGIFLLFQSWWNYLWDFVGRNTKEKMWRNIIFPVEVMMVEFVSSIRNKLGKFAPEWMQNFGKEMSASYSENVEKMLEQDKQAKKNYSEQMLAIEADTKKSASTIFSTTKDLFDSTTIKRFTDTMSDEWKNALQAMKKASEGTPLLEEFKKLEDVLSSKGFEAGKKEIEKVAQATKSLIPAVQDVGKAFSDLPGAIESSMKKQLTAIKLHKLELDTVIADAESRASYNRDQSDKLELINLDKKQTEEIKRLTDLAATKDQIDKVEAAHRTEQARVEYQQRLNLIDSVSSYIGSNAQALSGMFDNLYAMSKNKIKEFFYAAKAAAIAETIMNTAQAVTKALAQGGIWGMAQAGIMTAVGTVQVAKITSETLGFEEGGKVPGTGNKDTIPAMLTPGEFVIPQSAAKFYGANIMESLKQRLFPKDMFERLRYNMGGFVPPIPAASSGNGGGLTLINVPDPNMLESFLQKEKGRNTMINFIANNAQTVKRVLR